MEENKILEKYIVTPNILYFDACKDTKEREEKKEGFLLSISEPDLTKEIRLSFLLGNRKACLTSWEKGQEIKCETGYGWECFKILEEKTQRVCWILKRKAEAEEYKEASLWVAFSNIAVMEEGISYLEITDEDKSSFQYVPLIKNRQPPRILRFSPVAATIRQGEKAVLKWETAGGNECVINPGNIRVPAFGTMEVEPKETMRYTLDVCAGEEKATESTWVYLFEQVMEDYLTAEPKFYCRGSRIRVFFRIGEEKGSIVLTAGGSEEMKTKAGKTMTASFESGQRIVFSYMDKEEGKKRYLSLFPDESQVIMEYVVAARKEDEKEGGLLFAITWNTKGAKEIQIFVRVFPKEERKLLNGFKEYLITSKEEEGTTFFTPEIKGTALYCFILRTKNMQGQLKEAVYLYENEREVGNYDNLQRGTDIPVLCGTSTGV